jgi:hypothetical protein
MSPSHPSSRLGSLCLSTYRVSLSERKHFGIISTTIVSSLLLSLLSSDILIDGHVLLKAGKSALLLHGREILCLEVNYALFLANAVGIVQILGGGEEPIGFSWCDRVHDYLY